MSVNRYNPTTGKLERIAGGTLYADAPIGEIHAFGGSVVPNGYLLCDGQAVSRTTYSELFTVIGTAFGSGDGSTTFNVPDLREVVPVGAGESTNGNIAAHNVYDVGEFKDDQMQGHEHKLEGALDDANNGFKYVRFVSYATWRADGKTYGIMSDDVNGNPRLGTTTHGKQLGVNYIIKAKQVAVPFDVAEYIRNQNVLSDYENITLPTTAASAITMPYDGYLTVTWSGVNDDGYSRAIYVNGVQHAHSGKGPGLEYRIACLDVPIKKGDTVYCNNPNTIQANVRYYKLRDYTGR